MSVKAMAYVWETPYKGAQKLMLLAIADRCDDEGTCYPGVTKLAEKCGIKTRAAQALITELEKNDEIVAQIGTGVETGHGKTNRYYMKKYRASIGLKTPLHGTRIHQITPRESGVQDPASLEDGVQKSASQAMQDPASQGMQKSAYNTSGYTSVDTSEKKKETTYVPSGTGAVSFFQDLADEAGDPAMFSVKGKKQTAAQVKNGETRLSKPTPPQTVGNPDIKRLSETSTEGKKKTKKRAKGRMDLIIDATWGKSVSAALLPLLMGNAKAPHLKDYNIEDGMTEGEIVGFGRWYERNYPGAMFPQVAFKVQSAVYNFRSDDQYETYVSDGVMIAARMYRDPVGTAESPVEKLSADDVKEIQDQIRNSSFAGVLGDLFSEYQS